MSHPIYPMEFHYDGECRLCLHDVAHFRRLDQAGHLISPVATSGHGIRGREAAPTTRQRLACKGFARPTPVCDSHHCQR